MELEHCHQQTPQWVMDAARLAYTRTAGALMDGEIIAGRMGLPRRFFDLIGQFGVPRDVTVHAETVAGQVAEWHLPTARSIHADTVVLYQHGGGMVFGSVRSHRALAANLAQAARARALVYNYRLAPEHPYPAALEDAVTVYRHLLEHRDLDPAAVVFAGDSAGGALSLAMLAHCRDHDIPLPAGAVLISPWTDFEGGHPSLNGTRDMLLSTRGTAAMRAQAFVNDEERRRYSPLQLDLTGLPPLLVQLGTDDLLFSEGLTLHDRLQQAGNTGRTEVWQSMTHDWHTLPFAREAAAAYARCGAFVRGVTRTI